MAITIASSPTVSESSIKDLSKKQARLETKETRRANREARREAREAKREARRAGKGNEVSIPENNGSSPNSSPSTQAGSGAASSTAAQTSLEIPTPAKSRSSSISDLRGANVVNFTVQGQASGGSHFSVFASGKGPGAIDPEKKKAASASSANDSQPTENPVNSGAGSVDTVA